MTKHALPLQAMRRPTGCARTSSFGSASSGRSSFAPWSCDPPAFESQSSSGSGTSSWMTSSSRTSSLTTSAAQSSSLMSKASSTSSSATACGPASSCGPRASRLTSSSGRTSSCASWIDRPPWLPAASRLPRPHRPSPRRGLRDCRRRTQPRSGPPPSIGPSSRPSHPHPSPFSLLTWIAPSSPSRTLYPGAVVTQTSRSLCKRCEPLRTAGARSAATCRRRGPLGTGPFRCRR